MSGKQPEVSQETIQNVEAYFNLTEHTFRELMEAVKRHCGWTETRADIATDYDMYIALERQMKKEQGG
jgi:hypothetical protein